MIIEVASSQHDLPFHTRRRNVHSQCGEDGVIEYLLGFADIRDGYFVEFGAWDGRHLSNCAYLSDQGWAGCFIEGDPERFSELRKNYATRPSVSTVNAVVGTEGKNSLSEILTRQVAPLEPTVLSIDIDGMDYHVWASLTEFRPLLCIVEFNPTIPASVAFVQKKDATIHHGCSLRAFWRLAQRKGYELVAVTDWNGFFMREDVCRALAIPTYNPEQVKDTRYETLLFHGFDGTLFAAGSLNLLWHGIEIGETELQVLPSELRHFPPCAPDWYSDAFAKFKRARSG
jgi:nitrogen regulatory protein PII-like uncharacterized protein